MLVMAIDPGVTSGFCYAEIKDGGMDYFPFQMADDVDDLWRRLETFQPDHIIMEDFEFRQRSRAGLNLFPVQLIGVARLWAGLRGKVFYPQKAAQGKSYYTDNILKQVGLYVRGVPHGMDASRHLLQWFTFGPGYEFNGQKKIEDAVVILDSWVNR